MMVLLDKTATVCEFEPVTETCRVKQDGSDQRASYEIEGDKLWNND